MKRPNLIFVVADDLGYADLGCYGGRDASFGKVSPVLDAMASSGLRFTQGYANAPVCSPTRFALMTGRYHYRLPAAAHEPISSKGKGSLTLGLPPAHPTLPSLLRDAGYSTALIGKWHLGYPPSFGPLKSGYQEFFGPMSGGVDYFTHCSNDGMHDLYLGEMPHCEEGYLSDLISTRAAETVHRLSRCRSPFFLSVHYTAPHWPWETRNDAHLSAEVRPHLFHLHGGSVETYRRMIHHMDEGVGWLLEALRVADQIHNTLVVFTSDNGGERFSDNWPLVGGKMDLTEGGIRVPWIAYWPEAIGAGGVSAQHCLTMDWSATMLELGGAQPDPNYPLDGVSLGAVLRNPQFTFPRSMYWRMLHREQRAYRNGDWKYLRVDGNDYLFNLRNDERERANLARIEAERLAQMRSEWEDWDRGMPPIPPDATVNLGYLERDMPHR